LIAKRNDIYTPPPHPFSCNYFSIKNNLNIDSIVNISGDTVKYLKYLPHYFLTSTNLTFNEVKVFQNNIPFEIDFFPKCTYWAKNIGIIRREMFDGKIWELKKFKIKQ